MVEEGKRNKVVSKVGETNAGKIAKIETWSFQEKVGTSSAYSSRGTG